MDESGRRTDADARRTAVGPKEPVKVKRKDARLLSGFFERFGKRVSETPRCTTEDKRRKSQKSGVLEIDCVGCGFGSDLDDDVCRLACSHALSKSNSMRLILRGPYTITEYGEEDIAYLKELGSIADSLSPIFPKNCGLCGQEHQKQINKIKDYIRVKPGRLLASGIERGENEDLVLSEIDENICRSCEERTIASVECALKKIRRVGVNEKMSKEVRPFFSSCKVRIPAKEPIVNCRYEIGSAEVTIHEDGTYFIRPPEYSLNEYQLGILYSAYERLKKVASQDNRTFRQGICQTIRESAKRQNYILSESEACDLEDILARYTCGLDIIELLLRDNRIQDIYINSPTESNPVMVKHSIYGDCPTNIYAREETVDRFVTKFKIMSGRAFSETSPVLDMELEEHATRVSLTGPPISPDGHTIAFRRGRERPWTLLHFIENRMLSPVAGALLSVLVNEESSILVCGDRGSGKTSLLSSIMSALSDKRRILTIEDTFELPVLTLVKEGYGIQRMKVRSATSNGRFERSADDALRSILRMGDSAIVMGEVRGREANVLYEAMSVGGGGNCVLGTIHAKSPQSLFERVVYSLGVPEQSFKSTDIVVMAEQIKRGDARVRRVGRICEVKKDWTSPDAREIFQDLMTYDHQKDVLVESEDFKYPSKDGLIEKIAQKRGSSTTEIVDEIYSKSKVFDHAVEQSFNCKCLLDIKHAVALNAEWERLCGLYPTQGNPDNLSKIVEGAIKWIDKRRAQIRMGIVPRS